MKPSRVSIRRLKYPVEKVGRQVVRNAGWYFHAQGTVFYQSDLLRELVTILELDDILRVGTCHADERK